MARGSYVYIIQDYKTREVIDAFTCKYDMVSKAEDLLNANQPNFQCWPFPDGGSCRAGVSKPHLYTDKELFE